MNERRYIGSVTLRTKMSPMEHGVCPALLPLRHEAVRPVAQCTAATVRRTHRKRGYGLPLGAPLRAVDAAHGERSLPRTGRGVL